MSEDTTPKGPSGDNKEETKGSEMSQEQLANVSGGMDPLRLLASIPSQEAQYHQEEDTEKK